MGIFTNLFKNNEDNLNIKNVCAIIVAAGESSRMALSGNTKQLLDISGVPVIAHTLCAYEAANFVSDIVLVARETDLMLFSDVAKEFNITKLRKVIVGGATRSQSVKNGIAEVPTNTKYLAIADGARPCIRPEKIDEVIVMAAKYGGAAVCAPIKDTLKKVDLSGKIVSTVDRERIYAVQTPQVFDIIKYNAAITLNKDQDFSDDCQYFEKAGFDIYMVPGDADNIKITYKEDIAIAEGILEARTLDV